MKNGEIACVVGRVINAEPLVLFSIYGALNLRLSRKLANPIYFPGLPAIRRERLFHARRVGRNVEPDIAYENRSPFVVFLIEKLAAIAGELTNYRRQGQSSIIQVDQIDAPLARRGVVEAERLRLDAEFLVGGGDVELFKVRIAVEKFLVIRDAIVLDPGARVIQAVRKTADMRFPVADQEIKVVRTIALGKVCGIRGGLSLKRKREDCDNKK